MTDAHRFGFTLPADGEHLLA
ncbi:TPA: crossover junction endodeoxyribonuclease RusA, partial [Escherichia coli]|nr:crossover junction endodeoxyribonuclease RusA [Escherichia coli]HAJ2669311.1 crossover junction endodeoxyribonuclease RusA [Escherichia coli]